MTRYKAELKDGTTFYIDDYFSFQTVIAFEAYRLKSFGTCDLEEERASDGASAKYKGYFISYDPPPTPVRHWDWRYVHEDYDGPKDGRCGAAACLDDAKQQIDDLVMWDEDAKERKVENGKA
jgi:hypothetical protein